MPLTQASLTDLQPNFTALQLLQYVRDALLLDSRCSVVSSNYTLAIPFVVIKFVGSLKAKGSVFIKLDASGNLIRIYYYPDWDANTNTSTYSSPTLNWWGYGNTQYALCRVFYSEQALICCFEQPNLNVFRCVSLWRPTLLRTQISEDYFPHTMLCEANNFNTTRFCRLNYYDNSNQDIYCNTSLNDPRYGAKTVEGDTEIRAGVEFSVNRNDGVHALSNNDFVRGAFSTHSRWYPFSLNGRNYIVVCNISGGLAVEV
jgi:hypothetical protein